MEFDTELLKAVELKISKNIMQLMRTSHNAFIVNILLNMHREPTSKVEAMELAGITLRFNPKFIVESSDTDIRFSLLHEAWHIPFFDVIRGKGKEADTWNQACDHYNNLMIQDDKTNGVTVPDWATCNKQFRGKGKDDIYQYLLQQQQNGGGGNQNQEDKLSGDLGGGKPQQGDEDGNGDSESQNQGNQPQMSEADYQQLQKQMESMVQQSAMQAKMAGGQVPAHIQNWLEDLYNPKLPWHHILQKYMNDYSTEDYSYQKVNRKFFPHGIILPTTFSEGLGKIAIANDESCSVSNEEFKTYLGAIKDIKDKLNPESMEILAFTTQITKTFLIDRDADIDKIKFRGHGGTHIPCVFEYYEKQPVKPQVLIIFSDMESALPTRKPSFDTIWIAVNNKRFKPPFGRAIHIEV